MRIPNPGQRGPAGDQGKSGRGAGKGLLVRQGGVGTSWVGPSLPKTMVTCTVEQPLGMLCGAGAEGHVNASQAGDFIMQTVPRLCVCGLGGSWRAGQVHVS